MLDLAKYTADFFKLPRPALQKRWVREYDAMATHVQGRVAKRLIKERRPYEDEEIRKYRETNYEPVTQGPFRRFNTDLSRVFSESQVTVEITNDELKQFIDGSNFAGMNLRSFWSRKLCRRMIVDPNGYLIRWVDTVPDTANVRVQPTLHLVLSKNVLHKTDEVFTWLSNERSMVVAPDPAGGQEPFLQPVGLVYFVVTKTGYFKYAQTGRVEDKTFEMKPHYAHLLGRLPIDVLGGDETSEVNPDTNEDDCWLQSFVANALPFANECARQWSDHQGVLVVSGFPLREMQEITCQYMNSAKVRCSEGWLRYKAEGSDETIKEACPSCRGTGKAPPFGPYGVLMRPKPSTLEGKPVVAEKPMVQFISPDPAILEFGSKTWRDYLKDLEKELNLLFVDEAQSGVAKEVDREPKVAKLDEVGHHMFSVLMRNTIKDFAGLMLITIGEEDVNIILPPTFISRTEADLTAEMKEVAGLVAAPITVQVNLDYSRKRFSGDREFNKTMEFLSDYDPLFGMSGGEITGLLSGFIIDTTLVRRHNMAYSAAKRLIKAKGLEVLEAPDIFAQVDAAIEELMPAARVEAEKPVEEPAPGGF